MPHRLRPRVIAPRGVIEGNHYSIGGGVALKAIDSRGYCIDFSVVETAEEYDRELLRLQQFLDDHDPLEDKTTAAWAAQSRRAWAASGGIRLV